MTAAERRRRQTDGGEPSLAGVIGDVEEYLRFELDEGETSVQVSPDVVNELGRAARIPSAAANPSGADVSRPAHTGVREKIGTPRAVDALNEIANSVRSCTRCVLHKTRTKTVPGQGCPTAELMFIGEAPGHDEDLQGLAFVGAAGQLLTKIIEAMGLTRDEVFIANILKCRPPGNETPLPEQMEACMPFLRAQIAAVGPKVIVTLGGTALQGLFGPTVPGVTRARGKWMVHEGIDTMPTFHPSYLLRSPSAKKDVWADMIEVLRRVGRTPPPRHKERAGD